MITINKKTLLWSAFYVLIFFVLLQNSFSYLDHDLGWHLEVGRQSLIDKDVARADLYDYPLKGTNWVDHEWLTNIFVYLIFDKLGYVSLNIIFVLIIIAALFVINYQLQNYFKKSFPLFALMALEILGIYAMRPHLGIRMQELGILFLALLFLLITHFQKTKNQKLLWAFPLFFLFWINLHASFLVGLFALWSFFFYELLGPKIKNWPLLNFFRFETRLNQQEKTNLFVACLLSTFATFLTPYGLEYFYFLKTYSSSFYLNHITEWLPAWTYPIQHLQLIYSALLASVILLPIFMKEKKRHDIWRLALALFFFLMALRSRRHFPLFFVASLPLVVEYLFYDYRQRENSNHKFFKNSYLLFFALSVSLIVSVQAVEKTNFTNDPFKNQRFCHYYPCGIVDFIDSDKDLSEKRLLNDYSWGGWLIYVRKGKQIFIDGRIPQYEYNGKSFMAEYYDFFDPELIEQKLEEHQVELIAHKHKRPLRVNWLEKRLGLQEEKLNSRPGHFHVFLESSTKWEKIYEDKVGFVYVKR